MTDRRLWRPERRELDFHIQEPWRADALCAQVGGDAFFPEKGDSPKQAKAICGRCPAKRPCLEYALEHRIRPGVWGGYTDKERRRILEERDRADAQLVAETAAT
jgi:WhiB family redox-sensing transcriptional regulator